MRACDVQSIEIDWDWPFRICGEGAERFNRRSHTWVPVRGTPDNHRYCMTTWVDSTGRRRFKKDHTIVWITHTGIVPTKGFDIDHINGIRDDNRISNLRIVTHRFNLMAARVRLGNWEHRKIPIEHHNTIATLPSTHNWAAMAQSYGVHKYALLNLRCRLRKQLLRDQAAS